MKWIAGALGFVALIITLVGGIHMGNDLAAWAQALGHPLVADAITVAWRIIFAVSLAITTVVCSFLLVRMALVFPRMIRILTAFAKGVLGMKAVSRDDAIFLILGSDFFRAKRPSAAASSGLPLRGLADLFGRPEREVILERNYARHVLNAFGEQRPDGVVEGGYDREMLDAWLDSLAIVEATEAFGDVPRV